MTNRREQALTDIVTEFEEITEANGYRTDAGSYVYKVIRPITQIPATQLYEIGIEFGSEELIPIDQGWSVFNSFIDVYIQGVARVEAHDLGVESTYLSKAGENLLYDIRRTIGRIIDKYITISTDKWNISPNTRSLEFFPVSGLGEKRNRAAVYTMFQIQLRNMDWRQIEYTSVDGDDYAATMDDNISGGKYTDEAETPAPADGGGF